MTIAAVIVPISLTDAVLLGAIQGVTEFLPVSSSGHLRLAEVALSAHPPTILFDIALHVGTLVAVILFFRRDLMSILVGLGRAGGQPWYRRQSVRQVGLLVLASVPTAVIGLALRPIVTGEFPVGVIGGLLLINGLILLFTRRCESQQAAGSDGADWGISPGVALAVGLAQGLGVLPGISRSGITIATAMLLGVRGRPAAVFSFLLSIPSIVGAMILESGDASAYSADQLPVLFLAIFVALVVGLACLSLLMGLIRRSNFHHFAWYCFALGLAAMVWGLSGAV